MRAHFFHITHAVSQVDFIDMKSVTHHVFDWKVGRGKSARKPDQFGLIRAFSERMKQKWV